ncbi:probable receptor-like serine/threonine-protein kinase At5g57670 isoform X3 [Malus sylvestris]|uniref:probable receptor-like serine/threonine-protein kinase At5g57670 isoform X3 n=1 Tax=Malus sylvestris TaxID=3752 RepID=UPI0021ACC85E|nr:probable receptor-like serine/threonine-protein kinase At5g57670 isoform X3 [Malus sylvestris]
MKYIRTNSLKRLFSLKWRSLEEVTSLNGSKGVENNEILKNVEAKEISPRPTWKCFSYEEISDATNVFSSDEDLAPLDWKTRYKITIGRARGLGYLHKGCQRRIIHRDIKSTNILLTLDLEPQISDFGLAKWLPSQWTHHSIAPIEGTFGHLAPEYYMHGIMDEKTDVFAFGVILLELISGRKPVDGSNQSLHGWAKPILNLGEIERLVDPRLRGAFDVTQLKRLAFAGSLCIRASPTWRPPMNEVLEVMESEGQIDKERWKMAEEEVDEFWGFEDLEYECNAYFSISPHDSISTASC